MSAYVVVEINVTDPVRYEEYKRLAAPTVAENGGRYIVRGGPVDILEGSRQPARIVILEFPSREHAKTWWDCETYRAAKAIRHAAATTEMIVVDGI